MNSSRADLPSFDEEESVFKKMARYLSQVAAGEVRTLLQECFDLPGRAELR
jgi:hypothetical protein